MKRAFGSLIIMSPSSPRVHKLRLTRNAIVMCVLAGVLSFGVVVAIGYSIPLPVAETERARLEKENEALRTENRNLEVQAKRLDYRVSRLEEASKRITNLMEAD